MTDQQSFPELFVQKILGDYQAFGDGLASQIGGTSDTTKYTRYDEAKMWNYSPIADPNERAQAMLTMYQQGMHPEDITDAIYPQRRKLIASGRPDIQQQIAYAKQMDRQMAQQARDVGIHFPHDETWAEITKPNAPTQGALATPSDDAATMERRSSAGLPPVQPVPAGAAPVQAAPTPPPMLPPPPPPMGSQPPPAAPGWAAQTGALF